MSKNDVKPIISQPKNITTRFPEITKIIILSTKEFNSRSSLSTFGSYRKYENAYSSTKHAIVVVKSIKLKEIKSM